jgi:hypothetical protein
MPLFKEHLPRISSRSHCDLISRRCGGPEIVVIEDGSSEDAFGIAKEYVSRSSCNWSESHVCATRNRIIAETAREELISLDADDQLCREKLESSYQRRQRIRKAMLLYEFLGIHR